MVIEDLAIFIVKAAYYMLPAYFANMAPAFFKNCRYYACPVDFGKKYRGKEIFGSHKTWRGLFLAVVFGGLIFYIQQLLFQYQFFKNISLIDYPAFAISLGFLLGLGAIIGDLAESFLKRRIGIEPGKPWVPFDQLDFVIGALLVSFLVYIPQWEIILAILFISPLLHITFNHLAFYLRLSKNKW